VDASPHSLAAIEAAVRLAVQLEAELEGLYVEDEDLLRGAELPITRMVGSYSGQVRLVEKDDMEQQLRVQARRARETLERIARRSRVRWSFRVSRGAVSSEVVAAAAGVDLISLGCCGWSMVESGRIGRTTQTILSETVSPVLLLRHGLRVGQTVLVICDGSPCSRDGLSLASQMAGDNRTPLVVLVPGSGERAERIREEAAHDLDRLGAQPPIRYRIIPKTDADFLEQLTRAEDAGILILPTANVFERGFNEVLSRLECPVLVVR
jgi:nucleotide-binding universal stress UspA family protein